MPNGMPSGIIYVTLAALPSQSDHVPRLPRDRQIHGQRPGDAGHLCLVKVLIALQPVGKQRPAVVAQIERSEKLAQPFAAFTIARMPARIAPGKSGQAATISASSGGNSAVP
jgi:hypothetical protein